MQSQVDRERELQRVAQVAQPPAAKGVMEMMLKYLQDTNAKDREARALEDERDRQARERELQHQKEREEKDRQALAEREKKDREVCICAHVCVRMC